MLKIKPPDYKFCPFCGEKLQARVEEEQQRKFCPSCHWMYYPHVPSAVAAVIVRNGEVLMVKRGREPYRDTWMFPAGFIDFGEHPLDALSREVKEETGLKVDEATLVEISQTEDDPREPGHFCFFYRVTTSGGEIKTDEQENKAIAWFNLENPPEIGWKSHKHIMKQLQAGVD
ncbi:NUDIX hydrolase [Patescibacteria group bacterium]|nr:NUDIX hydrolase [Patescibacteria group bacterium]MBU1868296.1 NUDIX hydrolase [Patescibacteria group bacterium]